MDRMPADIVPIINVVHLYRVMGCSLSRKAMLSLWYMSLMEMIQIGYIILMVLQSDMIQCLHLYQVKPLNLNQEQAIV